MLGESGLRAVAKRLAVVVARLALGLQTAGEAGDKHFPRENGATAWPRRDERALA